MVYSQKTIQYTIKDGLPTNHIYDIAEDKDGFIWLATNRGLVKFDGHNFRTFTHKDGLPNNDVWKLRLDAKKRLWFFSKSNQQGFVKNDSLHLFRTIDNQITSPNNVFAYPDGISFSLQRNKFNGEKFILNEFSLEIDKLRRKELEPIIPIFYNKKIIYMNSNSIRLYDFNFNLLSTYPYKNNELHKYFRIEYFPNQFVVIKDKKAIIFINMKTNEFKRYNKSALGLNLTKETLVHFNNNLFQITSGNQFIELNKDLSIKEHLHFDRNLGIEFSYKDRNGNIWLWGKKVGLLLMTKVNLQTPTFLQGNKINVIGEISGKIVSASQSDGLHFFNNKIKKFEVFRNQPTTHYIPYRIVSSKEEQFIVMDKRTIKVENDKWTTHYIKNNRIKNTGGKDLLIHDGIEYGLTSTYLQTSNNDELHAVYGGKDIEVWNDTLFIGSSNGLKIFRNNQITSYPKTEQSINLPILRLAKGNKTLWIGTDGKGVFGINNNGVHHITATDDLSVNEVVQKNQTLWLATNQGVKKIKLHKQISNSAIIDNFYENDGLPQNNTNTLFLKKDSLWVGTDEGISILKLNQPTYSIPIQVYFKDKENKIIIDKKANRTINIGFGAINYGNQEHLQFEYRLLPNEQWQPTESRTISFNQLEPGEYTLEVKAVDQHQNSNIARLPLEVMHQWWETKLAIIAFILIGLLVLGSISYLIYSYVTKKKIDKIERDKTIQRIQLQALRSQMNPHFVHNSLNAIQYYIQMNEIETSEKYLIKFSELIRLFFEYSRENKITIAQEVKLIKRYIEIEKMRFGDKFDYTITVDPRIDIYEQETPTMLLQPLVENAINHGLFHKKTKGTLHVKFNYIARDFYSITIEDDGIGIERAKEINIKSLKNYKSHSSMVLSERLKLLNDSKEWSIDYTIESSSELGNSGTKVTIAIKQL